MSDLLEGNVAFRLIHQESRKLRDTIYSRFCFREQGPRRDPNSEKSFRDPMNGESGPVCLPSVIVRRDGASQCSPHSEGMRRRVFRTVGDVAAEERNGRATCCFRRIAGIYPRGLSSAHTEGRGNPHATCCNPRTYDRKIFARNEDYRATCSRAEAHRTRRWTIYRRVRVSETERELHACAIREVGR